jgi:diketogulonate reductase-like aldo/keto reductase
MAARPIPASGEMLPVVGLGTYQSFDVGSGAAEREPVKEVLRLFVQQGGKLVDSSPMYGPSESVVGDLATELGINARLFMATKVWTSGRDAGIRQMEESLRRMKVERMDLMQIHNLLDWKTHLDTLKKWKAAGRIRYIGITHYHSGAYAELERLMKTKEFDFVQFNYSIAERDAEERILPLAHELGVAVIANRPFAAASLFSRVRGKEVPAWAADFDCKSWGQFFLKYILAHPAVTCVIPATGKPQHLLDNMMAGVGRLPDAAMRKRMVEFVEKT